MKFLQLSFLLFGVGFLVLSVIPRAMSGQGAATAGPVADAPTGFDNQTNGFVDQPTHQADQAFFEEVESIADGLGPVYNAQSCRECHQNPVSGAISQVRELRAGHLDSNGSFVPATVTINDGTMKIRNRSLINQRAICPGVDLTQVVNGVAFNFPNAQAQETVPDSETIRTLRTSLNTLGDGFVESIADVTLLQLAQNECNQTGGAICGQALMVPVAELSGAEAVGRFGWKDQVASLLTFAGDAYLNEMGITNRLFPTEVTNLCDIVPDPEDKQGSDHLFDIDHFARFMRASKAPPRDQNLANSPDAQRGEYLFHQVGCASCHVSNITTAPPGAAVAGGAFIVPPALGNKVIHPFSDFLLHDVGTGDGIVQNGGPETAKKLRTAPLWGVRMRAQLMHDGQSLTFTDAILRHSGEAAGVINNFTNLTDRQKQYLVTFLKSL